MLRQKFKLFGIGVIAAALVATVAAVLPAFIASAEDGDNDTNTANVIKVTPVRSDIEIAPGESDVVEATVSNVTDKTIVVRVAENDFVAGDDDGTPSIILDDGEYAPTHSLKRFMKPVSDVTIPAGEAKTINVEIDVPADAQAGGYYGAIRFLPTDPDTGGQVNLSPSVASLIVLTVPGDSVDKLELIDFSIKQNGKSSTFFNTPDGIEAIFRFENKGNIHAAPFGMVTVKKGDNVVFSQDFNPNTPKDLVLPDSSREWSLGLDNLGNFGHFTLEATISYGKSNQTIEVTKSFWIIPLAYILGAIGGLVLIIILIVIGSVMLKRHKKKVQLDSDRGRL